MATRKPRAKKQGRPAPKSAKVARGPKVHALGERRLDAVMEFVQFAVRPMPLATLLDEAPRRMADIVDADVASLYLLEGEGNELVMRGNVGFPETALGQVRLSVGEGITGAAVELMRPISVAAASGHEGYRHFPELGEERFPVFAVVPILGRSGPLGAIAVQRRKSRPFEDADIELLVALSGAIAAGVRHAEVLDAMRERSSARRAGGGTRKVTLTARPLVPGRALGALAAIRRPPSRPSSEAGEDDARRLRLAFEVTGKALASLAERARAAGIAREASFVSTYQLIVDDTRLRGRALELVERGAGIAHALGQVAREATRAAANLSRDPFLEERARDIEDLCDAVVMIASEDARVTLPSKAILMADQLTVFDVLVSARSQPSGVALTDRATGPRTRVLAMLLGVPAIADAAGLFRWAADGDVALLDADHGLIVINPSRSEIAALRRDRKPGEPADTA